MDGREVQEECVVGGGGRRGEVWMGGEVVEGVAAFRLQHGKLAPVHVPGDEDNLKITLPADFERAQRILEDRNGY